MLICRALGRRLLGGVAIGVLVFTTVIARGTAADDQMAVAGLDTALAELGKAIKTIFLCRYLQEESRRDIHEDLKVVENWISANGFIFYGERGEIATNRVQVQELAVLAPHLLQICVVYVNMLFIRDVLADPARRNRMTPDDWRGLTPLIYAHANPYGRIELDMRRSLSIAA